MASSKMILLGLALLIGIANMIGISEASGECYACRWNYSVPHSAFGYEDGKLEELDSCVKPQKGQKVMNCDTNGSRDYICISLKVRRKPSVMRGCIKKTNYKDLAQIYGGRGRVGGCENMRIHLETVRVCTCDKDKCNDGDLSAASIAPPVGIFGILISVCLAFYK